MQKTRCAPVISCSHRNIFFYTYTSIQMGTSVTQRGQGKLLHWQAVLNSKHHQITIVKFTTFSQLCVSLKESIELVLCVSVFTCVHVLACERERDEFRRRGMGFETEKERNVRRPTWCREYSQYLYLAAKMVEKSSQNIFCFCTKQMLAICFNLLATRGPTIIFFLILQVNRFYLSQQHKAKNLRHAWIFKQAGSLSF